MARPFVLATAALSWAAILVSSAASGQLPRQPTPAFAIDQNDADRFAQLMKDTNNRPTVFQVQQYLERSGRGVAIFTPFRIKDAANLAGAIKRDPQRYRYAINTCLPLISALNPDLRSVYSAFRRLVPGQVLPRVFVVFGASNSGGTAQPDAQVIGLEIVCSPGTSAASFRTTMRAMFAHETVHSWQPAPTPGTAADRDLLLYAALREGVADYLALRVTGRVPNPERHLWAVAREEWLWREFQKDRALIERNREGPFAMNDVAKAAFGRWFGNHGSPPDGWSSEAGYWIGMRIAQRYVSRSPNQGAAIRALLLLEDPASMLRAIGYQRSSVAW